MSNIILLLVTLSMISVFGTSNLEGIIARGQQSLLYSNKANVAIDESSVNQDRQSLLSNHQLSEPQRYEVDNKILQSKKYHSRHKLDAQNKDKAAARGWMIAFIFTLVGAIVFIIYYRKCKLKWQLQMMNCNDECEQSLNNTLDANTPLLDDALPVLISNGAPNGYNDKAVL